METYWCSKKNSIVNWINNGEDFDPAYPMISTMVRICSRCGNTVDDDLTLCHKCGKKMAVVEQTDNLSEMAYVDWYFCDHCVKAVKLNICPNCKQGNLNKLTEPYSRNIPENLTQADIDNMWNKPISGSSERAYTGAHLILAEIELGRRKECEKLGINWKN